MSQTHNAQKLTTEENVTRACGSDKHRTSHYTCQLRGGGDGYLAQTTRSGCLCASPSTGRCAAGAKRPPWTRRRCWPASGSLARPFRFPAGFGGGISRKSRRGGGGGGCWSAFAALFSPLAKEKTTVIWLRGPCAGIAKGGGRAQCVSSSVCHYKLEKPGALGVTKGETESPPRPP